MLNLLTHLLSKTLFDQEKDRSEFGADQPTKPEANASGNDAVAGNGSSEHGQPEQSSHDASSRGRRRSTHETPVESPKRGYLKSLTIHEHDAGFTSVCECSSSC